MPFTTSFLSLVSCSCSQSLSQPDPDYSLFLAEKGQDANGLLDVPSTRITMSQHSTHCSFVSSPLPGQSSLGQIVWEEWTPEEEGSCCLQQPQGRISVPWGAYHWDLWPVLRIHCTKLSAFFVAQIIKYRSPKRVPTSRDICLWQSTTV